MKKYLFLAGLLCVSLVGCSKQTDATERLEGSYKIEYAHKFGIVEVSGGGEITLGADCAMDITLNSSGGSEGKTTTRYVRAPGGPTLVSLNGGEWSSSMDGTEKNFLRLTTPLVGLDYPIDKYGDSFCWFGVLHKFASGSDRLEFSTEHLEELLSRSVEDAARVRAQTFSAEPQVVACITRFFKPIYEVGQTGLVMRLLTKYDSSLTSSAGVVVYAQRPVKKDDPLGVTVTFTPQNKTTITAPVSVTTTIPPFEAELIVAEGCTADPSYEGPDR